MSFDWSRKNRFLMASTVALGLLVGSLLALQKPVTVAVDGKEIKTRAFSSNTVGDVLKKHNIEIGQKDRVNPAMNSLVQKNMRIEVFRAFRVRVIADGQEREIYTTPVSVRQAIAEAGFRMGERDIVKTLPNPKVVPDQRIEVIRVSEQEVTVEEELPFQVERVNEPNLEKGLTKTLKAGKNGKVRNTVLVTYHNGKEVERKILKSEPLIAPINKVVAMGSITSVSRGGQRLNFKEVRYMEATAYTYTGFRTATGQTPVVGTIAVDPGVIPLGSKLYVEGYGYGHAGDTGGAVKGDKIDVFMEEYSQCVKWGRRTVKVYLLE